VPGIGCRRDRNSEDSENHEHDDNGECLHSPE
jgi:hypothetical protein